MESPTRSAGLTAQLQALRKALYHKYVQEVAALKEQHDRELRRLRDESERKERDSDGELDAGRAARSGSEGRRLDLERTQDQERLEEVAKVGRLDLFLGFILEVLSVVCDALLYVDSLKLCDDDSRVQQTFKDINKILQEKLFLPMLHHPFFN